MEITILCKVVDNYGDIGFVYRLARNISELYPSVDLRLVVSDLPSFAAMAPFVQTGISRQETRGWQIFDWNDESLCHEEFSKKPPEIILQCFQCERPEWLDEILFAPEQKNIFRIVNLEYLTAEPWADDFHLLKSGTRSILVKKVNFMPGFTKKTGGLVLDTSFLQVLKDKKKAIRMLQEELAAFEEKHKLPASQTSASAALTQALTDEHTFCLTVFAYKRNFTHLVRALKFFTGEMKKNDPLFKVHAFVAAGLASKPFEEAWKNEGRPFAIQKLPYLRQETWDALLCSSDMNFVRGEDSYARACLCGKPFVWHAYPQDEEVHLVKVQAILDRIKDFVEDKELFSCINEYFLLYNKRFPDKNCTEAEENKKDSCQKESPSEAEELPPHAEMLNEQEEERLLKKLLLNYKPLLKAMENFSQSLISNGNLTEHLIEYLRR